MLPAGVTNFAVVGVKGGTEFDELEGDIAIDDFKVELGDCTEGGSTIDRRVYRRTITNHGETKLVL